jgi:hypothetical protein
MAPVEVVPLHPRQKCLIEWCDRLEELANGRSAGGLCSGHRKRKQQGRPLDAPLHERMGRQSGNVRRQSPRRALLEAALQIGDVSTEGSSDVAFRRALDRLTHAARVYRAAVKRKLPSNR